MRIFFTKLYDYFQKIYLTEPNYFVVFTVPYLSQKLSSVLNKAASLLSFVKICSHFRGNY